MLYVSPLKALGNDVQKNLAAPPSRSSAPWTRASRTCASSCAAATRPRGSGRRWRRRLPTSWSRRRRAYILLGERGGASHPAQREHGDRRRDPRGPRGQARRAPGPVPRAAGSITEAPPLRIGLSATQRPVEEVARFLVAAAAEPWIGDGTCRLRRDRSRPPPRHRSAIELPGSPLEAVMAHEVWAEYYDRLAAVDS